LIRIFKHFIHLIRKLKGFLKTRVYSLAAFSEADLKYKQWVKETTFSPSNISQMKAECDNFNYKPLISIVVPVYNVAGKWLHRAIQSVLEQAYENWELCLVDDASPKPHIRKLLNKYQAQDKRIHVKFLEVNQGMSGSSNEGLSLATGEYIALLDHDDELSHDSLFEVVKLLNRHPEAQLIFSDEDKLTMSGQRLWPVKKQGWNPDLFLTYNYICHLVVCRRELMVSVGGFRKGFEGSQDYDLLLRVTEQTDSIFHIPKILYHWRMIPGSAAAVVDAKSQSFDRTKKAIEDALQRRGIKATITDGKSTGTFRIISDLDKEGGEKSETRERH
jgi:glycosyltransferase involved in cell wall biosynthesis